MTMEDDHSEKVIHTMKALNPRSYENLLTDNGSQFSRKNSSIKKYCEEKITGKHI